MPLNPLYTVVTPIKYDAFDRTIVKRNIPSLTIKSNEYALVTRIPYTEVVLLQNTLTKDIIAVSVGEIDWSGTPIPNSQ